MKTTEAVEVLAEKRHFIHVEFERSNDGFTINTDMHDVTEQEAGVGVISILKELPSAALEGIVKVCNAILTNKIKKETIH